MAQVTQSLIDEFRRHIERGAQPPYTLNEFEQLCYAWEECQRLRAYQKAAFEPLDMMGSLSVSACGCSRTTSRGVTSEFKCEAHRDRQG